MQFSELLNDHEITKLPSIDEFQRVVSTDRNHYRITHYSNRKKRFIPIVAGLAVVGMMFWSVYTAHDAKRMALENSHLLTSTKIAVVNLERDINAKVVLIEKRLNDALEKMDESICHMSEALVKIMAVQTLNYKFDRLIDTLMSGRLNTAILPLTSVRHFIHSYSELQHGLYSLHPQLLYELADVEVLSDDLHTTSIMRGIIRVPNLLHAYENVSMHFIFTNESVFGPIYMGISSNKTMDGCRIATHNQNLMICPGYRMGNHNLQQIHDPVSIINGLVIVNHNILVQVDPGKEIAPFSPFMKKGPFIIDRMQAKSVTYNSSVWFIEPISFKVESKKITLDMAKTSIPILSSDWSYSNNILTTLESDFKKHEVKAFQTFQDMDNELNSGFDHVSGFFPSVWNFMTTWYGIIVIIIILILIIIIVKYVSQLRSICIKSCCCKPNGDDKNGNSSYSGVKFRNEVLMGNDYGDSISISPLDALRIVRSNRSQTAAIMESPA